MHFSLHTRRYLNSSWDDVSVIVDSLCWDGGALYWLEEAYRIVGVPIELDEMELRPNSRLWYNVHDWKDYPCISQVDIMNCPSEVREIMSWYDYYIR